MGHCAYTYMYNVHVHICITCTTCTCMYIHVYMYILIWGEAFLSGLWWMDSIPQLLCAVYFWHCIVHECNTEHYIFTLRFFFTASGHAHCKIDCMCSRVLSIPELREPQT